MSKLYRLRKNSEFQALYATAKRCFSESFVLFYKDTSNLKIGVVASKKISKSAVKRNRSKRRLRELLRVAIKDGFIKSGQIIIVARKKVLIKEFSELQQELKTCWQKLQSE